MSDEAFNGQKQAKAWRWLDSLREVSGWTRMDSDHCPLGAYEIGLPTLLFTNPDAGPRTVSRASIVIIAPLWDFAMSGMGEEGFEGFGEALLGDRLASQSSLALPALESRKEGFRATYRAGFAEGFKAGRWLFPGQAAGSGLPIRDRPLPCYRAAQPRAQRLQAAARR